MAAALDTLRPRRLPKAMAVFLDFVILVGIAIGCGVIFLFIIVLAVAPKRLRRAFLSMAFLRHSLASIFDGL
jgi:hypothetical protein